MSANSISTQFYRESNNRLPLGWPPLGKRSLGKRSLVQPSRGHSTAGFTFAEILAAMLFVAVVIPVALHGIAIANRAHVFADRQLEASRLAEQMLNEIILTEQWQTGNSQGDFGEEWPGYRWTLSSENWDLDDMRIVSVSVIFAVQQQTHFVRLSTLVDDTEESES